MDLRCQRCAQRHPTQRPTLLAEAELVDVQRAISFGQTAEVAVYPVRRLGQREVAERRAAFERAGTLLLAGGTTAREADKSERIIDTGYAAYSSETRSVELSCRSCRTRKSAKLRLNVALDRLRPALEAGHEEVLVGARGEVCPVGVLRRRARPGFDPPARLHP